MRVLSQMLLERAGIEPVPFNNQANHPLYKELPPGRVQKILHLDRNKRCEMIARVWPEFPEIVARRFEYLWEGSQVQKDRAKLRYDVALNKRIKGVDPVRILLWEKELFECAFNEILEGIDEHLWALGLWSPETLAELAVRILPSLQLHLAKWNARSVRPPLPLPRNQVDQITSVEIVEDDEEYEGWFRVGYFERELIADGWRYFDGYTTVMAGIEFANSAPDPNLLPLAQGQAEAWRQHFVLDTLIAEPFVGPLVGLDNLNEWLGIFPVLGLQPNLIAACCLEPHKSSRFELVDISQQAAVKLRYWRVRPLGNSIDAEQPRLEGCDLIIRPDIFDRIGTVSMYPPRTVRRVFSPNKTTDSTTTKR